MRKEVAQMQKERGSRQGNTAAGQAAGPRSILSKLMRDKDVLPRQIMLYRELVRAVFLGT